MSGPASRAAVPDRRVPYVAVIGPGDAAGAVADLAAEVGRELARRGAVVLCGGLGGVMAAAARGAAEAGGRSVGLLPGVDAAGAAPDLDVVLPTGLGEGRNGVLVTAADAVVAVGGSAGTLLEMAWALRLGRPLAVLAGWSVRDADHRPVDGAVPVRTPAEAVDVVLGPRPRASSRPAS